MKGMRGLVTSSLSPFLSKKFIKKATFGGRREVQDGGDIDMLKANSCSLRQKSTQHCKSAAATAKSLQSCPTLCDPRDGNPPGSPVPGILQARTLEWVAISFSNA